ncbi:MAG: flagellar biosynthesis repressor FlbT [Alphaproteobacteria bacterium]|nr:flagellar biosynthesis repressor FlbT [Alphaproteobacteria bacterium]
MPLKLSLAKGEKFVVNGAVIKNDGPDINLVFENKAHILRQKDIMSSAAADTPARRVYLALQCAYIFKDRETDHLADFENLLSEFTDAAPSAEELAEEIRDQVSRKNLYGAMKDCQRLIDLETERMNHVQ